MLYGMAEPVKKALHKLGHVVREYTPTGELLPGMDEAIRVANETDYSLYRPCALPNAAIQTYLSRIMTSIK